MAGKELVGSSLATFCWLRAATRLFSQAPTRDLRQRSQQLLPHLQCIPRLPATPLWLFGQTCSRNCHVINLCVLLQCVVCCGMDVGSWSSEALPTRCLDHKATMLPCVITMALLRQYAPVWSMVYHIAHVPVAAATSTRLAQGSGTCEPVYVHLAFCGRCLFGKRRCCG